MYKRRVQATKFGCNLASKHRTVRYAPICVVGVMIHVTLDSSLKLSRWEESSICLQSEDGLSSPPESVASPVNKDEFQRRKNKIVS